MTNVNQKQQPQQEYAANQSMYQFGVRRNSSPFPPQNEDPRFQNLNINSQTTGVHKLQSEQNSNRFVNTSMISGRIMSEQNFQRDLENYPPRTSTSMNRQQESTIDPQNTKPQNSYQRMLQKYNAKKEKSEQSRQQARSARPADLPLGATMPSGNQSFAKKIDSARARTNHQPQYLQYLEKTLDKTEVTAQNVKQLNTQVLTLEQRFDKLVGIEQNQDDLYEKLKFIEQLQEGQGEEQQLTKLLFEAIQQKQKDHEAALEVISGQVEELNAGLADGPSKMTKDEQIQNQKIMNDNQSLMKDVLLNIDSKIEAVVARKLLMEYNGNFGAGSADWNQKEQKILEIIDTQGKDIAIDIAKLEEQIQNIQQGKLNSTQEKVQPLNLSKNIDFEEMKQELMNDIMLKIDQIQKKNDDSAYEINSKLKTLDSQFTQLQNQVIQVKIDNQGKMRNSFVSNTSKKRGSMENREQLHLFMESLDDDLHNLEKRLNQEFTKKLSGTVDKIGVIIKKQETRLNRLVKRVNQLNRIDMNQSRLSPESRGRTSHISDNLKLNKSRDGNSRNNKASRDRSYEGQQKQINETIGSRSRQVKLQKSNTQQVVAQQLKQQSMINVQDKKMDSPLINGKKKLYKKTAPVTRQQQKSSQMQVQTSLNSFNILNKHYRTFSPVLSSTSKSVHNIMQTIKEDLGDNGSNSQQKGTIITNLSKRQTVTSGQRSPTTTNHNLIASHRTNQNISNLKIATAHVGQQQMLGPYGTVTDLDYIPKRARRTNSNEFNQNNKNVSKNQSLKSEKSKVNSSSKTRSRVASKKRKTKNKIVNGKLMKESGGLDSRPQLGPVNQRRSYLNKSHNNSLQRSREVSKSPNNYSNTGPAGRGVPDPYTRSRSNNSLKRPTPRRMQEPGNKSLSRSTSVKVTKEMRNNTSQISFMSQKSKQILTSMHSRKSKGKASGTLHEDKITGYWRPTESSKRKSATRKCIEKIRREGNWHGGNSNRRSSRRKSKQFTESSDMNDPAYKPLRVRESSSPQYLNRYDRTREHILDGIIPGNGTDGLLERGSYHEKSNRSFSPMRPHSRGHYSRDDRRSNSSFNATKGILKPSSHSGSIHGSVSKRRGGAVLGANPLRVNDMGSPMTQRSHNREIITSGQQNIEQFNKDLNSSTNSSPYARYPQQLGGHPSESFQRGANNRSRSLQNRNANEQNESRDAGSRHNRARSDSNEQSNERSRSRSGYKVNLDMSDQRSLLKNVIKEHKDGRKTSNGNIANQPRYQVMRDERGFKRRIEYPDDDEDDDEQERADTIGSAVQMKFHERRLSRTEPNEQQSMQQSSNRYDMMTRQLLTETTNNHKTNIDHEDDLCYSKSVAKGSIRGSAGPSTRQNANSNQNTDSRQFQSAIMLQNNLKQSTPQFEERNRISKYQNNYDFDNQIQYNNGQQMADEYLLLQHQQEEVNVADRTLGLSQLDPSSNYGTMEKRIISEDKKIGIGSSRLFPMDQSSNNFGGGSSMMYGAGLQSFSPPKRPDDKINVQLGDSQLQQSQISHIQNSAAPSSLNENRSVQLKATNERLAKLEQMYEELTILEQKAANTNVKGDTYRISSENHSKKGSSKLKNVKKSAKSPTELPKKDQKSSRLRKESRQKH